MTGTLKVLTEQTAYEYSRLNKTNPDRYLAVNTSYSNFRYNFNNFHHFKCSVAVSLRISAAI